MEEDILFDTGRWKLTRRRFGLLLENTDGWSDYITHYKHGGYASDHPEQIPNYIHDKLRKLFNKSWTNTMP